MTEADEGVDEGAEGSERRAAQSDPNFMASLARGLAVIQAFSRESPALTIAQVGQKTGIPRAAARRCLHTLAELGFAVSHDGRLYELRPKVLSLGFSYLHSLPLARATQPVLRRLSAQVQESCSIAVLDGDDIVYVARASESRIMSIDLHVGSRLPAAFTSMGRVLLAHRPDELDARLSRIEFRKFTPHTLADAASLRAEILRIRENGYAIVDQELELGLLSIAAPIRGQNGAVVAAVNIGAHASRMPARELADRFLPLLKEAADELSLCVR